MLIIWDFFSKQRLIISLNILNGKSKNSRLFVCLFIVYCFATVKYNLGMKKIAGPKQFKWQNNVHTRPVYKTVPDDTQYTVLAAP